MRYYRSHKIVEASKITSLEIRGHRVTLFLDCGETHTFYVSDKIFARMSEDHLMGDLIGQYLVRYADGYMSLSPARAFEECYHSINEDVDADRGLTFSDALEIIKHGGRVARAGWNGKGMFLFLVPGSTFKVNRPPLLGIYPEGTEINYHGHIDMKTAQGYVVPWLASQADMLADDWEIVADAQAGAASA